MHGITKTILIIYQSVRDDIFAYYNMLVETFSDRDLVGCPLVAFWLPL
jgi:hypothetical protein